MAKKIRVIVDYGGPLVYEFDKIISVPNAVDLAEQFVMEYIPKYTVEVVEEEEEDEKE